MGEEEPRTIISGLVQFVPLEEMQASTLAVAVAGITICCVQHTPAASDVLMTNTLSTVERCTCRRKDILADHAITSDRA